MNHQEQMPENFNDSRELPINATAESKINEILERAAERGTVLTETEKEEIKKIKKEASVDSLIEKAMNAKPDGTEEWESEKTQEEA